jgi:hypothetical protein
VADILDREYADPTPGWVRAAMSEGFTDGAALAGRAWTPSQRDRFAKQFNALVAAERDAAAEQRKRDVQAVHRSLAKSQELPLFRDVIGGAVQGARDLAGLGLRAIGQGELADTANKVNEQEEQALAGAAGNRGVLAELGTTGLRGAARSLVTAAPAVAAGAGAPVVIGTFTASRANQAITEANDAGLTGQARAAYVGRAALIEGGVAGAFQAFGLGGAEKFLASGFTKANVKSLIGQTFAELGEENLTEVADALNQAYSKITPDVTLDQVGKILAQTTVTTLLTMGAITGARVAQQREQRELLARGLAHQHGWSLEDAKDLVDRAADRKGDFGDNLGREVEQERTLTPGGLAEWAVTNEEKARGLAGANVPSRDAWKDAGLPRRPRRVRERIAGQLREVFTDYDQTFPEGGRVPAAAPPAPDAAPSPTDPQIPLAVQEGEAPPAPPQAPVPGGPDALAIDFGGVPDQRVELPPEVLAELSARAETIAAGKAPVAEPPLVQPTPEQVAVVGQAAAAVPTPATTPASETGAERGLRTIREMIPQLEAMGEHEVAQAARDYIRVGGKDSPEAKRFNQLVKRIGANPVTAARDRYEYEKGAIKPGSTDWRTADADTLEGLIDGFKITGGKGAEHAAAQERLRVLRNPIPEGADWRTADFKTLSSMLAVKAIPEGEREAAEAQLEKLAPKPEPAAPPEPEKIKGPKPSPWTSAKTGQAFEATLMRGEGREDSPYNPLGAQVPIIGPGLYLTPDRAYAEQFGPKVTEHQVRLERPLVIRNDDEWRALTKRAGWKFPNPFGQDPKKAEAQIADLRRMIEGMNHDGVVVVVPADEATGKTMQAVFGRSQVVKFATPIAATPTPPAPEPEKVKGPKLDDPEGDPRAPLTAGRREKLRRILAGERVVVSPDDLRSWEHLDESNKVRTVPNPARMGLLDQYIAFVGEAPAAEAPPEKVKGPKPKPTETVTQPPTPTVVVTKPAAEKLGGFLRNLSAEKQKEAEELKAKLRAMGTRMRMGIDPELLSVGTRLTVLYVEAGVRNFGQYARGMVADLGPWSKDYLLAWWQGTARQVDAKDMDDLTRKEADAILAQLDAEQAPPPPTPETPQDAAIEAMARQILLSDRDRAGKTAAVAAMAKDFGIHQKVAEERVEAALVDVAREVANDKALSPRQRFDKIVGIYESQPEFKTRSSTSKEQQAFSTPAPLAYAASVMAEVDETTSLYEPTAGTGMLTIAADPAKTHVNENWSERAAILSTKGFKTVTTEDGRTFVPTGGVDRVLANPPFGNIRKNKPVRENLVIGRLEHEIALTALDAMKDDGMATLILGAEPEFRPDDGTMREADKNFLDYLLANYHVVGTYEVAGKLYEAQGSTWPTYLVVIGGRRAKALDPQFFAVKFERLEEWADVWDKVAEVEGRTAQLRADREPAPTPPAPPAPPTPPPAPAPQPAGGKKSGGKKPPKAKPPEVPAPKPPAPGPQPDGPPKVVTEGAKVNDRQREYAKASQAKPLGTIVPALLAPGMAKALTQLSAEVGDVDAYVAEKLGMMKEELLDGRLAAEQIDGVGLAIRNVENGRSLIIGDQTGIGKGRQAAALKEFAKQQGWTPVFVTADPKLFSDMYSDTKNIGKEDHPLILGDTKRSHVRVIGALPEYVDTDEETELTEEEKKALDDESTILVRAMSKAKQDAAIERIVSGESTLEDEGFDTIYMPYSQIANLVKGAGALGQFDYNPRHKLLRHLATKENVFFVLDESHRAAGADSITGAFMRGGEVEVKLQKGAPAQTVKIPSLLNEKGVRGVIYLSATYAKKPETMPLYFKTSLGVATKSAEKLMEAFEKGGVALQQWAANALADTGEMIRRERDFAGVRTDEKSIAESDEEKQRAIERVDTVAEALRAIVKFSRAAKDKIEEDNDAESTADTERHLGTGDFSSVLQNYVAQMLLATKVDAAAREAIESKKKGEATIIVLSNTMESFLKDVVADNDLEEGAEVKLTFGDVLKRALDRTMRAKILQPGGMSYDHTFTPEELGLEDLYEEALAYVDVVEGMGLPASPIDALHQRMRAAGLRTDEITGRTYTLDYRPDGGATLATRDPNTKNETVNAYQAGKLDVVILNSAGATGMSLHASEKNPAAGQRPRHMVIAQPDLNIDTVKQVLGRILRTGMAGAAKDYARYTLLSSPVEAERRPFAVLKAKLASLNANTTADAEDDLKLRSVDFLNKYGNKIVSEHLAADPELAAVLAIEISQNDEGEVKTKKDVARTATGRMAILPNAEQATFYNAVTERYNDYIAELKEAGLYDLEVEVQEKWDAQLLEQKVLEPATDPASPFLAGMTLNKYSINDPRLPYSKDEVRRLMSKNLGTDDTKKHRDVVAKRIEDYLRELEAAAKDYVGTKPADPGKDAGEEAVAAYEKRLKEWTDRLRRVDQSKAAVMAGINDFVEVAGKRTKITVRTDGDVQEFRGVLVDLKLPTPMRGNPYRANTMRAVFAVEDPRRTVTVAVSRLAGGTVQLHARQYEPALDVDTFAKTVGQARVERTVITGNLISAFGYTKGKGQITTFRTSDGEAVTGLAMPLTWKLSDSDDDPRVNVRTGKAALELFRSSLYVNALVGVGPDGTDKAGLKIKRLSYSDYELSVSGAKGKGGVVYLDKGLRGITGDFYQTNTGRPYQVALDSAQLVKAVDYLLAPAGKGLGFSLRAKARAKGIDTSVIIEDVATAHGEKADLGGTFGMPEGDPPPDGPGRGAPSPQRAGSEEGDEGGIQAVEVIETLKRHWPKVAVRGAATHRRRFKREKTLGWYVAAYGGMRLQRAYDVTTAVHELGHHYDRLTDNFTKLGRFSKSGSREIDAELMRMGRDLYGDTAPNGGYKAEGFAEFIREYVSGEPTAALSERAPVTYAWWTRYLSENKDEARKFRELKDDVVRYLTQNPQAAIEALTRPTERGWDAQRVAANLAAAEADWIDANLPILRGMQATGYDASKLAPKDDPFMLLTFFARSAGGRTRHAALAKAVDLYGREIGKGLRDVLEPIIRQGDEAYKAWKEYMIARRALERYWGNVDKRTGKPAPINPGISKRDAEAIKAKHEHKPGFQRAADEFTEFAHRALVPLVQSGAMTQDEYNDIVEWNPLYAPMMRRVDGEGSGGGKGGPAVHRIKGGSNLPVHDPIDAMLAQYDKIQRVAMQAAVVQAMVKFHDTQKGKVPFLGQFMEEVPAEREGFTFEAEQLRGKLLKALDRNNRNPDSDVEVDTDLVDQALEAFWDERLTVFRRKSTPGNPGVGEDPIIAVVVNGRRRFFQIKPDLLPILEGTTQSQFLQGTLGAVVRGATQAQRLGYTGLNPAFSLVSNFLRDTFTAAVTADYHFHVPLLSAAVGAFLELSGSEWITRYKAGGHDVSTQLGQDMDAAHGLAGDVRVAAQRGVLGKIRGRIRESIEHPIDGLWGVVGGLRDFFSHPEIWPRLLEYRGAYEAGRKKWGNEVDALILAGAASKDLTVNFSRAGVKGREWNERVLFFNAALQSSNKVARAFGAAEAMPWASTKDRQANLVRSTVRASAYLTGVALLLYFMHRDEEWWKELPPHEKWLYLHPSKGTRIPLPFEVGAVFGALPIAMIENSRTPGTFAEALKVAVKGATPIDLDGWRGILSNFALLGPMADVLANEDWKGTPIVPRGVQEMEGKDQIKPSTLWLSRQIGALFPYGGYSPAKIEHVLNGYTGGLYRRLHEFATTMADPSSIRPLDDPSTIPVFGRLFLRPNTSRVVNDFYDRMEWLRARRGSKTATLEELGELAQGEVLRDKLSDLWKQEGEIIQSGRSAAEREQKIGTLTTQIQDLVRAHDRRDKALDRRRGLGNVLYRLTEPATVEKPTTAEEQATYATRLAAEQEKARLHAEELAALGVDEEEALEALRAEAQRRGHLLRSRHLNGTLTPFGARQARLLRGIRGEAGNRR